jgi:hypothetical protein
MTSLELAGLLAIVAWNLATYALVPVTAGLSFWHIMLVTQAATAVANTVPTVGPAIGTGLTYRMLGSWGYSRSRATTAMLVSGVWNSLTKLGLPVLALVLLALQGNVSPRRISAALAGIAGLVAAVAVFALLLRSQELARRFWAGRIVERPRRVVRFARLIHRPGRVLGGPSVRAAFGGISSLPWSPLRVMRQEHPALTLFPPIAGVRARWGAAGRSPTSPSAGRTGLAR